MAHHGKDDMRDDKQHPITGQAIYRCSCKQHTHITGLLYLSDKKQRFIPARDCPSCNTPMVGSRLEMHT